MDAPGREGLTGWMDDGVAAGLLVTGPRWTASGADGRRGWSGCVVGAGGDAGVDVGGGGGRCDRVVTRGPGGADDFFGGMMASSKNAI